jgi:hypothetical protein
MREGAVGNEIENVRAAETFREGRGQRWSVSAPKQGDIMDVIGKE